MPCTTILVGKKASYNGSCLMARNDDSGSGKFKPKSFQVVNPDQQPKKYTAKISHLELELPDNPLRYTHFPNVMEDEGIWAECGVNSKNVGMSATETITTNPRVLGADPLVAYDPETHTPGGLGEEDFITVTLPYVSSAREGVLRLGELIEKYGTYESNGIGFSDGDEIWWMETIGGHHWMARRVPDDCYVVMPNQLGIDYFDFDDAYEKQKNFMCSKDLMEFTKENHLDLSMDSNFNPRAAYGSFSDSDHVYNTPRAWYMLRYFNPHTKKWEGENADYTPRSDDLPWAMVPEKKITVEDVKYILSSYFQGTPFDPYADKGDRSMAGAYRPIGINRTSFLGLIETQKKLPAIQWIAFGSNAFNAMAPFYCNVAKTPVYLANTTMDVNTNNLYWCSRLIGAMADSCYNQSIAQIESYQQTVHSKGHEIVNKYEKLFKEEKDAAKIEDLMTKANQESSDMIQKETQKVLNSVLFQLSLDMKNAYARSDA